MQRASCTPWTKARKVMNQQKYNITNVNDDLTIPATQQNNANTKYFNSYLQQVPLMDTSGKAIVTLQADISTTILSSNIQFNACYNSDTVTIPVQFCNEGCATASPTMMIAFYDENPLTGGVLLKTETISINLPMDSCMITSFDIGFTDSVNLYIVANDSGIAPLSSPIIGFDECWLDNNTDSINIKIDFDTIAITVNTTQDTICIGSITTLNAIGGNTTTTYTWMPITGLVNPTDSITDANPNITTQYNVYALDTLTACSSEDSVIITVDTFPQVDLGSDTALCPSDTLSLDAGIGGLNYLWSTGDTTSTINVNIVNTYSVMVSGLLCVSKDSIIISNMPFPQAVVNSDTLICEGASVLLQAMGGTSYLWRPLTGLNDATISKPIATPNLTTEYWALVTDQCGNIDSANTTISIEPCNYYIPNAFTPNGDGFNDEFFVQGSGMKNYLLKIYDRWGNKVFESKDQSTHWKGSDNYRKINNESKANNGVYVYQFLATFEDGSEVDEKGNVTLIR